MWADKLSELHGDQLDILRAMQWWVHTSPWKDQFDFAILHGDDTGEPIILRL